MSIAEQIADVLSGRSRWCVVTGDCLDVLRSIPAGSVDAVVTDPPYGMGWDTDSTRFSGREMVGNRSEGRDDWGDIAGDKEPFDPEPWLSFPRVVLFGANHFAQRLPVGTTLVWIKRSDDLFGTFLSDAELAWMKGGYGVYCYRKQFPPPSRMAEANMPRPAHPTQKPIGLMAWAMERAKTPDDGLVLDPYCGSGTTGVACVRSGRRFIGIEKDERHANIARRRIGEAANHLFANTLGQNNEPLRVKS